MPKIFTSETQKTGEIGENEAVKFLMKHNFHVIERNYTKKWGEIDIIALKDKVLHFIEVKSVTLKNTSRNSDEYRPEDNMHSWKLKRLSRTIQTYLLSHKQYDDISWQFDLILVYLNKQNNETEIKLESDIIL